MPSRIDYDFIGQSINDGRLRFVELLGEGAYGKVYRAVDDTAAASSSTPAPKSYAVKVMKKAPEGSRLWRYQQREAAAHLSVHDHPNIVSIHGLFECDRFIYIALEYCPGGDLLTAMMDRFLYCNNDALLKNIFVQILDALEHCHENGVYHRDLKPDNILVNEDGTQLKIADFGLSTTAKVSDSFGTGTSYYMSPECIGDDYDFHPYSTESSDVWALGVILTNLVAGRNPWNIATRKDRSYAEYLENPNHLRQMLPISEETASILRDVFTDPVYRITIPELRERILAVNTFYMSDEDVAKGNQYLKSAAAEYHSPMSDDEILRTQSVLCDEDVRALLAQVSVRSTEIIRVMRPKIFKKGKENSDIEPKFVIAPTGGYSSDFSSDESYGPTTPSTHAQDAETLMDVPEFLENEKLGEPILPVVRKGQSLPIEIGGALCVQLLQ